VTRVEGRMDGGSIGAVSLGADGSYVNDITAESGFHPSNGPAGRYADGPRIGAGGFGHVRSVYDHWLGRDVAFKELHGATPEQEARLVREAKTTAGLDHPSIVPVYDVGRTPDGRLYYTMRLLHGGTLTARVLQAATESARLELVPLVRDAARGVAFAHEHGVAHRDLKPDNIMVGPLGDVQVADWGLAQPVDSASPCPSPDGRSSPVGTPHYWSPEAAAGGVASPTDDVYSLGAVLRDVLLGAVPRGPEPARRDLPTWPAGASPELRAIAERALALAPERRYPTALELSLDLTAWMNGHRVHAHVYSAREITARFLRARRVPLVIAAVAFVATMIGVGLAWQQTAEERNAAVRSRAQAEATSATLLARQAAEADAFDSTPEALSFARDALGLAIPGSDAHQSATGTRLSARVYPTVERVAHAELPDCRNLVPLVGGGSWLCLGVATITRLDEVGTVHWTAQLGARDARPEPTGHVAAVVDLEGALHRLDLTTGALTLAAPFVPVGLALGATADGARLWSGNNGVVQFVSLADAARGPTTVDVLLTTARRGETFIGVAPRPDGTFEALTTFGRTVVVSPSGVASPSGVQDSAALDNVTPNVDLTRASASVRVADDAWLVGTTTGHLFAVRPGVPTAVRRITTLPEPAAIERLTILDAPPLEGLVLVETATHGPALVHRESGAVVGRLPADARGPFVTRPSGELVSFGGGRAVWRVDGPSRPRRLAFEQGLGALAVDPTAQVVVTGGGGGLAVRVETRSGATRSWPTDGPGVVKSIALEPGGTRAVIARMGLDGALVVDATTGASIAALPGGWSQRRVGWLVDGVVWGLGYREPWRLWRPDGTAIATGPGGVEWRDGQSSPDARSAVLLDDKGQVSRLEGEAVTPVTTVAGATLIAAGPARTFWAARPGLLSAHAADGVEQVAIALSPGPTDAISSPVSALAVSPDGSLLVVGTFAGHLAIWRTGPDGPRLVATSRPHTDRVAALSIAGAGADTMLWSASWDHELAAQTLGPLVLGHHPLWFQ
jgi:hypothetical protein